MFVPREVMEETERMNMDGQCVGMIEIRDHEKKTEEKVTFIFVFSLWYSHVVCHFDWTKKFCLMQNVKVTEQRENGSTKAPSENTDHVKAAGDKTDGTETKEMKSANEANSRVKNIIAE